MRATWPEVIVGRASASWPGCYGAGALSALFVAWSAAAEAVEARALNTAGDDSLDFARHVIVARIS